MTILSFLILLLSAPSVDCASGHLFGNKYYNDNGFCTRHPHLKAKQLPPEIAQQEVSNPFSTVPFHTICPDAKYIDDKGIAWACKNCECIPYYAELDTADNDRGYCGIGLFQTGTWDPFYFVCRRHDAQYIYQKDHDGKVQESIIKTQAQFTLDAGWEALKGLYAIGAFFIYVPLVWIIGSSIQGWRKWTGDKTKE